MQKLWLVCIDTRFEFISIIWTYLNSYLPQFSVFYSLRGLFSQVSEARRVEFENANSMTGARMFNNFIWSNLRECTHKDNYHEKNHPEYYLHVCTIYNSCQSLPFQYPLYWGGDKNHEASNSRHWFKDKFFYPKGTKSKD